MARGRTSQPVTVWIWGGWKNHPAVEELRRVGHQIHALGEPLDRTLGELPEPDLILHPAAHGWDEAMFEQYTRKNGALYRPFVDAAVKAGRQRRKGK